MCEGRNANFDGNDGKKAYVESVKNAMRNQLEEENKLPAKAALLNAFQDLIDSLPIEWEKISTDINLTEKPIGPDEISLGIITRENALFLNILKILDNELEKTPGETRESKLISNGIFQISNLLGHIVAQEHNIFRSASFALRKNSKGEYETVILT